MIIERYNVFWLPLLANHSESRLLEGPLVVPLDCEWIWHYHRLNPVRYKSDYDEFYGKILDNQNVVSSGSFPYGLPPNLTNLNLGHNFLTGTLNDVLHGLENLKLMDLSFNSFIGELPTSFGSLTNLTGLFLQNNQFTRSVIFLANLSLFTGVDFTSMSVHDSPHMLAFSSSPMITPSRLPPFRAKTLKVSRRKSFSKSKTIIGAKAYTVAELQIATNNFSEENLIGEGSLGSVYRAEFPDGTVQSKKKGNLHVVQDFTTGGLSLSTDYRSLVEAFNNYGAVVDGNLGQPCHIPLISLNYE
ncbi:hypothetical protein OROMI_006760 [Orobanche minor]